MGLFRNLGKKAERLRQEAVAAREAEASHVCEDCGELLYTDHATCPKCGGGPVVAREEPETEEAPAAGGTDGADDGGADEETPDGTPEDADDGGPVEETSDRTSDDERTAETDDDGP